MEAFNEDRIDSVTNQINEILSEFTEREIETILLKIKIHHLDLKITSYEVQRLLKNSLG